MVEAGDGAETGSAWSAAKLALVTAPQDAVGLNAVGLRTLPVLGRETLANYLRTVRCRGHERFNSWDFCGQCGVHSATTWRIMAESHADIIAAFTRPELGHGHDLSMNVECPWTWTCLRTWTVRGCERVRGRGISVDADVSMDVDCPWTWTVRGRGLFVDVDCLWTQTGQCRGHSVDIPWNYRDRFATTNSLAVQGVTRALY